MKERPLSDRTPPPNRPGKPLTGGSLLARPPSGLRHVPGEAEGLRCDPDYHIVIYTAIRALNGLALVRETSCSSQSLCPFQCKWQWPLKNIFFYLQGISNVLLLSIIIAKYQQGHVPICQTANAQLVMVGLASFPSKKVFGTFPCQCLHSSRSDK